MGNGRIKQLKKIARDTMKDDVTAMINNRIDAIESYVKAYLERNDKREKAIRTWLINEVQFKMNNDLFNATCTIDAVVEVLAEAGLQVPDFAAKIDAKKAVIAERKKADADAKMKAEMEARAAKAKEAGEAPAADATPAAETAEQAS